MTDFILQALQFGVLGLCAITLLLVWRIIKAEQAREGNPRKGILQAANIFMVFCFALALVNGVVQVLEQNGSADDSEISLALQEDLRVAEDKLLQIRSAAAPILNSRAGILIGIPEGPERNTLLILVESLQEILDE